MNNQAAVRDFLATFINNISISDLDSIIQQSAMLYQLSSATDQITRNTAVRIWTIPQFYFLNINIYKSKLLKFLLGLDNQSMHSIDNRYRQFADWNVASRHSNGSY